MHPKKRDELLDKGWSDQDLKKAEAALEKTEKKDIYLSKIVFWSALVVILIANLLVSLILVPFLIVFTTWMLYVTTIILAGTIGFLYNFLIMDIRHLEKKHHLLATILIPLIALTNLIITSLVANKIIQSIQLETTHNPYIVGAVFAVAFILPYTIDRIRGKHHFYQEN